MILSASSASSCKILGVNRTQENDIFRDGVEALFRARSGKISLLRLLSLSPAARRVATFQGGASSCARRRTPMETAP